MRTHDWYTDRFRAYALRHNPEVMDTILDAAKEEGRDQRWLINMALTAGIIHGEAEYKWRNENRPCTDAVFDGNCCS